MAGRPEGRKRRITGQGSGISRRGGGLGSGPAGTGGGGLGKGGFGRTGGTGGMRGPSGFYGGMGPSGFGTGGRRGRGGCLTYLFMAAVVLFILFRDGSSFLSGDYGSAGGQEYAGTESGTGAVAAGEQGAGAGSGTGAEVFAALFGSAGSGDDWGSSSSGWSDASAAGNGVLNTSVASGARDKYTRIAGGGRDKVTIMVYMCGTDLESRSGMGTADLSEMAGARLGDHIMLLVYTGGCKSWRNQVVSSTANQIYQVTDGGLKRLAEDGARAMTDPDTLSGYIRWAADRYPADRYALILWDHGGGSVSGYGYDEKYVSSGSMELPALDKALADGGVKFDFVGFDACLMATAETALMLDSHADYLIASEETEPGVGWYYTDWLTKLGADSSMPTLEVGKNIADDFVEVCEQKCRGQKTTLSVIDLAETAAVLPDRLSAFAASVTQQLRNREYAAVSSARNNTREFASSSGIDQVDLADLAGNIGTAQGKTLAEAVKSAVKYNRTSSNMTNAYGMSIYFPYQRVSYVSKAASICDSLGMEEYSDCIRQFASLETSGQVAAGGTGSPYQALFGDYSSLFGGAGSTGNAGSAGGASGPGSHTGSSSYSGYGGSSYAQSAYGPASAELISSLLQSFLGSGYSGISGLGSSNAGYYSAGRSIMTDEELAEYLAENHFDASRLVWNLNAAGEYVMTLEPSQWALVSSIDEELFYDDGSGYIDLGLDDVFEWTEDGGLIADPSGAWVAIDGQPVAYYRLDTTADGDAYTRTGYVPALLNGERVNLIVVYDSGHPEGYIAGANYDYQDTTPVTAKNLTELGEGDKLDFICDYYAYDGSYQDSYLFGSQLTVSGTPEISDVTLESGKLLETYRFTDIYNEAYWSAAIAR